MQRGRRSVGGMAMGCCVRAGVSVDGACAKLRKETLDRLGWRCAGWLAGRPAAGVALERTFGDEAK